jgi:hypothetical protein
MLRRVVEQCHGARLISVLRRDLLLEQLYNTTPGPSSQRRLTSDAEVQRLLTHAANDPWAMRGARDALATALL